MQKSLATIAFNGEVGLADFSKAIAHFNTLMSALAKEVAKPAKIEWELESLQISSAIATVRGVSEVEDDIAISEVVDAYEEVGRSASEGRVTRFGDTVNDATRKLCSLINGKINSIRFETDEVDFDVVSPIDAGNGSVKSQPPIESIGAIQGRVQSLSNRGGLRFTLYDAVDDHAISCYLRDGMEAKMRAAWGKLCLVYGTVRRSSNGRVTTLRDCARIEFLEDGSRTDWRKAIGCAPAISGSISIEEAIRKGRDG